MGWLSKLKVLIPIIFAFIPKADKYTSLVTAGIEIAEATRLPGSQKREIGKKVVELVAETVNEVKGAEKINKDEAVEIYDLTVDAVVKATNKAEL